MPVDMILNHWENVDHQFSNYNIARIENIFDYFDTNKPLNIMELGTKRSNPEISTHHKSLFPNINRYVMVDVEDGIDVDVVCDVHKLSNVFSEEFDVIITCSGYEHFKYPQLASHEILKCLNKNGVVFIQTHQTYPLHGYPNDYFRFSLDALDSLFPRSMGTELIAKSYDYPASIIPIKFDSNLLKNWNIMAKSYLNCSIIIRKINDTPDTFIYEI
jgi:SAM-dependent methyltransferase